MKMIRVIAKKDGFRRAGRAWSGTTDVPAGELTKQQLAQLKEESDQPGGGQLVIQEVDLPDEKPAGSKPPGKPPAEQK